jgi:ornithine carbamoyltransferase
MNTELSSRLKNQSFIDLRAFTGTDLESLVEDALDMKQRFTRTADLKGRVIGLLFGVPSTRTRISFQLAIRHLGGDAETYSSADLQLSNGETLIDTAEVMGRFLDAIVVRLYDMANYGWGRSSLETLQKHARVPIVNALDDKDHPCQVMADLLTLRERFGTEYRKRKVVMAWGYAKRQKTPGVLHSMMTAGSLLGMHVVFAYPKGFELDPDYVLAAERAAIASNATIEHCHDLEAACRDASAIYVKSWKSLALSKEEDAALRETLRDDWRLSERHFTRAAPDAVFMDCMPLIRGDEADADLVDGPRSIRYEQAENRLHAQKAILAGIMR